MATEVPLGDLLHTGQEVSHFVSILEQLADRPVAEKPVAVVEVTTTARHDRPRRIGDELLSERVDEDELLEQRAAWVQYSPSEGGKIIELIEIDSLGHEHVTEQHPIWRTS